jgi:hypothetical protein
MTVESIINVLKSVRFVVDAQGHKTAAQLSISDWETLLNWIEDREDEAIFKEAMRQLKEAGGNPQKAGWLDWESVKSQWDKD